MKNLAALTLTFTLLVPAAQAAPAAAKSSACSTARDLDKQAESCDDNGLYADAGFDCLEKLESLIQTKAAAAKITLQLSNAAHVGDGKAKQASSFLGSGADYKIAMAALDSMIASAKKARGTVGSYLNNIFFPEEFDAPEELIGDNMEFVKNSRCYAEPKSLIEKTLETIDRHIADLERTKQAAASLGAQSGDRFGKVGEGDLERGAAVPADAPAIQGSKRKGKDFRPSDVTGTEKIKEKARP